MSFADLTSEVEQLGINGLEVMAWKPGDPRPEFFAADTVTRRPFDGELVDLRTKMGRRLRVTPDHPFFVCDGIDGESLRIVEAGDLTEDDWLPIAQDAPFDVPRHHGGGDAARRWRQPLHEANP